MQADDGHDDLEAQPEYFLGQVVQGACTDPGSGYAAGDHRRQQWRPLSIGKAQHAEYENLQAMLNHHADRVRGHQRLLDQTGIG